MTVEAIILLLCTSLRTGRLQGLVCQFQARSTPRVARLRRARRQGGAEQDARQLDVSHAVQVEVHLQTSNMKLIQTLKCASPGSTARGNDMVLEPASSEVSNQSVSLAFYLSLFMFLFAEDTGLWLKVNSVVCATHST